MICNLKHKLNNLRDLGDLGKEVLKMVKKNYINLKISLLSPYFMIIHNSSSSHHKQRNALISIYRSTFFKLFSPLLSHCQISHR